jgi:hypothetical protein
MNIIPEEQKTEAKNEYNEYGEANHHQKIVKNDISTQTRKHYWHLTRTGLPLIS